MLDYDDVLDEVGEFGRWQIWLFALLWIPSAVSAMQVSVFFVKYLMSRYVAVHVTFTYPF